MMRALGNLALVGAVALLALPADVLAGRGGGMQRGGGGMQRGGGGGMERGGGGMERGGGMQGGGMQRPPANHSPGVSSPRPPSNQGRPPAGNMNTAGRPQTGSRPEAGTQPTPGTRPNNPYATGAQTRPGGSSTYPNSGAAAAGAGVANRNQPNYPNAGAAAAGAGVANRNQPAYPNAGAAAAGADVANRNQPNYPNAGPAAAGAAYANRNQPAYPNAGAAAAGAAYANRNPYDQYHPGMVNGYWNGNNTAAWGAAAAGAAGYGLGAASGIGAWGTGSPMYTYGYSGYSNPYSAMGGGVGASAPAQPVAPGQPAAAAPAYDYNQPINTAAAPPEPTTAEQAAATFEQARRAFKAGDYAQALQLDNQALAQMPNDTHLHEFLALVQFAQGQYSPAAASLYSVLSVGPGWDWTTLMGMYPDLETYTSQFRALEAFVRANSNSAPARFVLAYHYMCQGHDDSAVAQLKDVVKLQPNDTLSAQLIAQFQPSGGPTPPPAGSAAVSATAPAGTLPGNWKATPAQGVAIALGIQDNGGFTWTVSGPGKPPATIAGTSSLADGVLTLSDKDNQSGTLAGTLAWQDANHFTFHLVGAPTGDPGLQFAR